jgi:hypothetical protein
MRHLAILLGLVASLVLAGCGGGNREAAKAPETNPWADYKGTYAGGAAEAPSSAEPAATTESKPTRTADAKKPAKGDAKPKPAPAETAKAMYGDGGDAKPDEEAAPAPRKATAKKRGKGGAGAKKASRVKS